MLKKSATEEDRYLVYLVCLVKPDRPDELDKQNTPV
jgi:hypothetical protein